MITTLQIDDQLNMIPKFDGGNFGEWTRSFNDIPSIPAGTSIEVQNEWEENTQTHTDIPRPF